MTRLPLFIVCQNRACQRVKQVKRRGEQRQRFCSHRCAATVRKSPTREGSRRGGLMRAHRIRERIRQKVDGMKPIDAFRYGYTLGLQSKTRQLRKRRAA